MTSALHTRWINKQPPFDGLTVSLAGDELAPLPALRQGLQILVGELERMFGDRPLYAAADWHEHDGYISEAQTTSWDEVRSWLASDDALQAAGRGDTYVRTAVLPEGAEFYLRFYIPGEHANDYPERRGNFDLTCQKEVAQSLAAALESNTALRLTSVPAEQFFDRSYG